MDSLTENSRKRERLGLDVDKLQVELDARVAANQGLRTKIAELYVEVQSALREKQELKNELTDSNVRLSTAESSVKWYQSRVHVLRAREKALQMEVETYRDISGQRQRAMARADARYKRLSADYAELVRERLEEKRRRRSRPDNGECESPRTNIGQPLPSALPVPGKEAKDEIILKLRSENEILRSALLSSKREQMQIEDAIFQLRSQLSKMLVRYKLLRTKNIEYEQILNSIQNINNENEERSTSQHEAANSLSPPSPPSPSPSSQSSPSSSSSPSPSSLSSRPHIKFKQRDQTNLNRQFSDQVEFREEHVKEQFHAMFPSQESPTNKRILSKNKCTRDQGKPVVRPCDESIDEGYADSSTISCVSLDIPIASAIDSVLLSTASDVLAKSKNLLTPIQTQVNILQSKMERLRDASIRADQGIAYCI